MFLNGAVSAWVRAETSGPPNETPRLPRRRSGPLGTRSQAERALAGGAPRRAGGVERHFEDDLVAEQDSRSPTFRTHPGARAARHARLTVGLFRGGCGERVGAVGVNPCRLPGARCTNRRGGAPRRWRWPPLPSGDSRNNGLGRVHQRSKHAGGSRSARRQSATSTGSCSGSGMLSMSSLPVVRRGPGVCPHPGRFS